MALLHVNIFSRVLGMATQMDVILPVTEECDPYPTLYLLHGMSDDHTIWQRMTSIERYAGEYKLAVVMPTTHLGWYTDMRHGLRYFTFLTEELPKICRNLFPRMSAVREENFVAGLSMGGYGAFKLCLGRPDIFGAAASLSGALDIRYLNTWLDTQNDDNSLWLNIFGDLDKIKGNENDLFYLAEKVKDSVKLPPKLYIWCGTEDFLYEGNVNMKNHLTEIGYDYTYEESEGDHQWKYWDEKIKTVLQWLPLKKQNEI